jgi:DNA polymerase family A
MTTTQNFLLSTTSYTPLQERDKTIVIDFETRSAADIRDVGADKYAEHPTTEILCLAYTLGQSKQTKILTPGSGSVLTVLDEQPLWVKERYWEKGYVVEAWNVGFEIAIWRNVCVAKLGWPDIPDEYWRDTMLQAAVCALPLGLGACGAALQLDVQKDEEGKSVMMKLSRPREQLEDGTWVFYERPSSSDYGQLRENGKPLTKAQVKALDKTKEDFETLYSYCIDDVRSEREIMYALPPVTDTELRHWQHSMQVNKRGVFVNEHEVDVAVRMIREYEEFQNEIIAKLTNGAVLKASNTGGIKVWMETFGVFTESVDKAHVVELLKRTNLPDVVRKVLTIRQEMGKASTSKLKKFKATLCRDKRFHGSLLHHGSTTGRFVARGNQIQNLPRGTLSIEKIEEVFKILQKGGNWRELCDFGNPMDVLSSCLRAFIQPEQGRKLLSADFANIEGRVVAWLSGEESKLDKFRAFDTFILDANGKKIPVDKQGNVCKLGDHDNFKREGDDLYKLTASGILKKPVNEITKAERNSYGKVSELACLGPQTQVLTNRGYCAILDLSVDHSVWDGVEFVKHEGVICKGIKKTINLNGVTLTPNHKVLVIGSWKEARQLVSNQSTRLQALATGSENLPFVDLTLEKTAVAKNVSFSATVGATLTSLLSLIYTKGSRPSASSVVPQQFKNGLRNIMVTQTFAPTRSTAADSLTGTPQLRVGVTTQRTPCTPTTGVEELNAGLPTAGIFSDTLLRYLDGITPTWKWTGLTSMEITKLETCASYLAKKIRTTVEKFKSCKRLLTTKPRESSNLSPVYDIVNAGPRNRFTIKTDDGHLIVHNCGFLGGLGAFKMMAKTYDVNLPDDEIKGIVKGWRNIHPNIVSYGYENYKIVMEVIRTGKPAWSGKIQHYLEDLFLCSKLPSGRVLRYAYPRIEMVTTPWGTEQLGVTFMTTKKPQNAHKEVDISADDEIGDGKWIRIQASPGLFTENYTQATARDVMVEAAYRCEFQFGYPITMSIHDELVAEVPERHGSLEEFERVMAENPSWAPDLPIACEGWEGYFYRK